MKGQCTTERVGVKRQRRNMKRMVMVNWNGKNGVEWKWMRVSVIEVDERKRGMGMDGNECVEIIDANGNGKQACVSMRVKEVELGRTKGERMNRRV